MKSFVRFVIAPMVLMFASCLTAFAWPTCKGQWVSVPKTTTGGTLYSTGDLLFQCQTPTPPSTPNTSSNSSSNSTANSSSSSASTSTAVAKQKQNQSQNQTQIATGGEATASNGDQSNAQSTSFNSTYTETRQTPMAYSPEAIPSAPCRSGFSGGGSTGFGAFSVGSSKRDEECDLRETARAFALLGNPEAAARILCETKGAKKAKLDQETCSKVMARQQQSGNYVERTQPTILVVPVQNPQSYKTETVVTPGPQVSSLAVCPKFDNPCKRALDEAVLFYKHEEGGQVSISASPRDQKLADDMRRYLSKEGVRSVITNVSEDNNGTFPEVKYVQ